jgi:excisionase family DNA binding protein
MTPPSGRLLCRPGEEIVLRLQMEYPPAPPPPAAADTDHKPLLYRAGEVADLLAIGESAVWELILSGRLPSVKIGASRRVSRAALEAFVAGLEAPADGSRTAQDRP